MPARSRNTSVQLTALRWAIYGAALGAGAPAGLWILLEFLAPPAHLVLSVVYLYTGVATGIVFALFGAAAGSLMARLRAAGLRDTLTDLNNRRFLMEVFPGILANAGRRDEGLCVLMLDLDHFKRVNDAFGHAIGDQTLKAVARALAHTTRRGDTLVRFGGEEFLVVCPTADESFGREIAERLRSAVEAIPREALGHPGPQTISVGLAVAPHPTGIDSDAMCLKADEALYAAKDAGRNRVVVRHLAAA